jgi:hypothetical protein
MRRRSTRAEPWHSKVEGTSGVLGTYPVKAEAQAGGRDRAHKVEHIIRNLDGRIGKHNAYGHDPRNILG